MRNRLAVLAILLLTGPAWAAPSSSPSPTASQQAAVASDDTDFLFRMGMLEGHLIIGHELLKAKHREMAQPHFGHPVTELYDDLRDYLDAHKFSPFDKQLIALEAAVTADPYSAATEKRYQDVIATVHKARELAPADIRASVPEMIKVCSDVVDAASGEYGEAVEKGKVAAVVEYHDSRGYLAYVDQQVDALKSAHADPQSQDLITRFKAVLAKAQYIVAPLVPEQKPRATVEQYRAIAQEAAQVAK